jgi:hypothetical protein
MKNERFLLNGRIKNFSRVFILNFVLSSTKLIYNVSVAESANSGVDSVTFL